MDSIHGLFLLVAGIKKADKDPGKMLDSLRLQHPDVLIQAVDAACIFGLEHVRAVAQIAVEAMERGMMIAAKPETELLLRISCTRQISEAIKRAGLKPEQAGCFICLAKKQDLLQKFAAGLERDDSVISKSSSKKKHIAKMLGIAESDDETFLKFLTELAAIT